MILVTGGAGFIGSNFILNWLAQTDEAVLNLDALTYAGNLDNLVTLKNDSRHVFIHDKLQNRDRLTSLLKTYQPRAVIHFAAESYVDRSIATPFKFLETNVVGTCTLLDVVYKYWEQLNEKEQVAFRFIHISTDEVYGSLLPDAPAFTEKTPYAPNNPYAASKASSDYWVRAYYHTYQLPTIITHCSNNYGPYQFPEKLIPLVIVHALLGKSIPLYGDGFNRRDWLYVTDHCEALRLILESGQVGEVYNIGGDYEASNIEVVETICALLDKVHPRSDGASYLKQILYVTDRLGHDRRYAIDTQKIKHTLDWQPATPFERGISQTVDWYVTHWEWVERIMSEDYRL